MKTQIDSLRKGAIGVALAAAGILGLAPQSQAITFNGTSGSLAAQVDFTNVGGNLQVVLSNIGGDVLIPADVLTAVFFDTTGIGTLTKVSALLNGSVVHFGPNGGGDVGGEWAYNGGLSGAPGGATHGISSAGFGLFGPADRFLTTPASNLQGSANVGGLEYGITSAGDNLGTGNAPVTGGNALIENSVTFTFSVAGGLAPVLTSSNFSHVSFQYGTAVAGAGNPGEPNVPGTVPEPASLLLLGAGIAGIGIWRRKQA